MEGLKLPAGERNRSASNMMFYAAIAGKIPTVESTPSSPPAPPGSLRWLGVQCRSAGHMMGTSLRTALSRCRRVDVLSITPSGFGTWIARECKQAKGFAERHLPRSRRVDRAH
jgi:hypothetical protein